VKIKKKNKVALNTITIKQIHEFDHFQDVESYDPVLNPVLNRELRRTGVCMQLIEPELCIYSRC
jgi:hypothetical protein